MFHHRSITGWKNGNMLAREICGFTMRWEYKGDRQRGGFLIGDVGGWATKQSCHVSRPL